MFSIWSLFSETREEKSDEPLTCLKCREDLEEDDSGICKTCAKPAGSFAFAESLHDDEDDDDVSFNDELDDEERLAMANTWDD